MRRTGWSTEQRRDRAVAFELERLVADRGERAQPLAADHVGLLDGELGGDLALRPRPSRPPPGCRRRSVTCRYFTPVAVEIGSMALWPDEVTPAVATVIWPGLAFIASISACRLVRGVGLTAMTGTLATFRKRSQSDEARLQRAKRLVGTEVLCRTRGPGIAVVRGFERAVGAERARGTGLVDHHDGLAERVLQFGGGGASDLVGRAAGSPGHDEVDRMRRLPVGGRSRRGREDGDAERQGQRDSDNASSTNARIHE